MSLQSQFNTLALYMLIFNPIKLTFYNVILTFLMYICTIIYISILISPPDYKIPPWGLVQFVVSPPPANCLPQGLAPSRDSVFHSTNFLLNTNQVPNMRTPSVLERLSCPELTVHWGYRKCPYHVRKLMNGEEWKIIRMSRARHLTLTKGGKEGFSRN